MLYVLHSAKRNRGTILTRCVISVLISKSVTFIKAFDKAYIIESLQETGKPFSSIFSNVEMKIC